jgi:hypothetical protein
VESIFWDWQQLALNDAMTRDMMSKLYSFFESTVEIPRIKHGNKQSLETPINEEVLILAQHLRNERESWMPRIANPQS